MKGTIVYFDPPYLLSLRKTKKRYLHETDDSFHRRLAERVKTAKCFVVISGYDSPLYEEIFGFMHKITDKAKKSNTGKIFTTECLWTNYNPENMNGYKIDFKY
jgi:DNA adenine methylase